MERPFEEGDIAQSFEVTGRRRVPLQPPAPVREQDERQVGPFLLLIQPIAKRAQVGSGDRFLGYDDECGPLVECRQQFHERGDRLRVDSRLAKHFLGDCRVAPARRQD